MLAEIDVLWTSIYAGAAVAILAACTGLCVITGVSFIASYRITDVTDESENIQLNMMYSIVYANKAHVDILAAKGGFRPSKTAGKHDGSDSKMLVPGGMSTYSKKSDVKEGGNIDFDFYGSKPKRSDFSRIS